MLLGPPWGGPAYINTPVYSLAHIQPPFLPLFAAARRVSCQVVAILPRNTSVAELRALAPDEPIEIEEQYLNRKLKTVTVYWGTLAKAPELRRFRTRKQPAL